MTTRIPSLDGLRAVSIALVIFGHLSGSTGYPNNSFTQMIGSFSHFGVQVFFVISGFLITTLLLAEQRDTGRIDLSSFYLRRVFRIFPAAFTYVGFATALRFLFHHPFPLRYLAIALTYTMSYSHGGPWVLAHLWSLSVEEQFYIFWTIVLFAGFGVRKQTCWAVMVISPIARMIFATYAPHLTEYAFPAVADGLAAGCLLALYKSDLQRLPTWIYNPSCAVAACTAAFASTISSRHSPLFWGLVPVTIAFAIHILVKRQDSILNNRVAIFVGMLSYSLYLFQQPFLTQSATLNKWSSFPVNLGLALFFALLSYQAVEKPMLRIGKTINGYLCTSLMRRAAQVVLNNRGF
jgi:peptidoglycan/LPS O-acetylase OafA/YrhL